jgi:hypothetical protein
VRGAGSRRPGTQWTTGTCPNCGRSDWCRQSDTGAYLCRRAPGPGLLERRDTHGVPYWIHLPKGLKLRNLAPNKSKLKKAESLVLQVVYGAIIQRLSLSAKHRAEWRGRGVSDEVIDRNWLRSWPATSEERQTLAADLYREFGEQMRGVPGWYVRDRKPMLAGGSGWVIPMWDLETERVVALRIRSDSGTGPKYYWLSSKRHGGTSPGIHARLAWPGRGPRRTDTADTVRVTEGEAKSIVLAERTEIPTLSVPGVALWSAALPWLRRLRARKVLLCYDQDRKEKAQIARAYLEAVRGLERHGFTVSTETWGNEETK